MGGIEVNEQRDDTLETALHSAVRNGDEKIINLLFKWNANPFIKNKNGQIPIELLSDQKNSRNREISDLFAAYKYKGNEDNLDIDKVAEIHRIASFQLKSLSPSMKRKRNKIAQRYPFTNFGVIN